MTETRNENFNLSKILENYLDKEDINGALNLIQNNKFNNKLYNGGCSEEIQVLFQYLTEDVFRNKIDFYTDCENLLKEVCKLANEDDVLFELLEIIETTKNDNIFISALKGLQISILYSKSGKTRGLQWILDTVLDYIKKVEIPDYLADKCEDEEGKLIENDDRVKRLLTIYLTVFLFLEPIINAARETGQANRDVSLKFRENVLLSFLFRLLSGKFAYLEIIPSSDKIGKSYALQCGENFVNLINILLRNNPFYTLSYVTTKLENITKGRSSRNLNVYLSEDKIPMLSLAVFYYLIFEHNLLSDECPKVYSYTYIFENVLESAIYLLTMSEGCFIYKGLKLCNGLFNFYQQQTQCKIEFDKYSRGLNYNFLSALINDIIYNNNYRNRKVGIEILKKYILLFDDAGIYFNVRMILSNKAWINLHGYMAILYKNVVDLKLSSSKTELSEFYRDEKFEEILELVCSLKKGSETDLLENSDLILSGLNMVRYFAIRDKENRTKFWNIAKKVEQQFLIPLRNAINFSRAHYQAEKVRVQEEAEDKQMEEDICNVVTNYGEEVPILTKVQKLNAIESAFSTFDIIECLLARASECLEMNKKLTK